MEKGKELCTVCLIELEKTDKKGFCSVCINFTLFEMKLLAPLYSIDSSLSAIYESMPG